MDTFDETRVKLLRQADAEQLLELLQISNEELLDRFEDRLTLFMHKVEEYLDEPE